MAGGHVCVQYFLYEKVFGYGVECFINVYCCKNGFVMLGELVKSIDYGLGNVHECCGGRVLFFESVLEVLFWYVGIYCF